MTPQHCPKCNAVLVPDLFAVCIGFCHDVFVHWYCENCGIYAVSSKEEIQKIRTMNFEE